MAPHTEDSHHGDSVLTSDSGHAGQSPKPVAGHRYSKEDLLKFNSTTKHNPLEETDSPAVIDSQRSVTIEEQPEHFKSDKCPAAAELEPQGDFQSNRLDDVVLEKKKKRKKSSGKNKNKQVPPNGFEGEFIVSILYYYAKYCIIEYFADTPITAEEYDEEKNDIYHHSRSFIERIQQCIQRYRARRKLNSERANIFSKYLVLGGVDASGKAFNGGLDKETLENSTAAEIADIQATDHIRSHGPIKFYNAVDPVNWVVDFEGVVKGFLSERAPAIFGTREHDIKLYCGVISNFLNYVLRHDVCNEYQMNVLAALKLCTQAERELQLISEVSKLLPGDFNIAASTLHGGSYHKFRGDSAQWDEKTPLFEPGDPALQDKAIMGMTLAEADRIFKTGIAFSGTYEHFRQVMAWQCHVVKEEPRSMEVCEIVLPTQEMRKKLIGAKEDFGHTGFALGLLRVRHWNAPDAQEEDMSDDGEENSSNTNRAADLAIDSFWLEENILEKCFIGMKLKATVRELNIGLKYIDEITRVECSFYTYLETERLDRWKEPILSTRPGPTVDDPEKNFADDLDVDHD